MVSEKQDTPEFFAIMKNILLLKIYPNSTTQQLALIEHDLKHFYAWWKELKKKKKEIRYDLLY